MQGGGAISRALKSDRTGLSPLTETDILQVAALLSLHPSLQYGDNDTPLWVLVSLNKITYVKWVICNRLSVCPFKNFILNRD